MRACGAEYIPGMPVLTVPSSGDKWPNTALLTRFSPENAFFSCDTHCQDITVRGRVITNSNALCYDNIPLCKELI
jgi:hypothetical protein